MDVSVSGKVHLSGTNIFRCYLDIHVSSIWISKIVNLKRATWDQVPLRHEGPGNLPTIKKTN